MRTLRAITIICFLAGIGSNGFSQPETRQDSKIRILNISGSEAISLIASDDTKMDVTTSSNDSAGWFNPFPNDGLGRDFEFFTQDKTKRGKEIFEVTDTGIEVLYDWADSTAPFAMINTIREYSSYNIELEYKWGERKFKPRHQAKRDAGILFHVHNDKVIWPSSLECQIQEGDTGDLWVIRGPEVTVVNPDGTTKNIHTRDEDYQSNVKFKTVEVDGWNHIRLEIRGAESGKFFVNGHLVNEITDMRNAAGDKLAKGNISLQAEGAEISYRNIRIQVLDE